MTTLTAQAHYGKPHPAERKLTGLGFLAILLGSFAVVASVNATMCYLAISTFSGEVDPHPYEHGLAYNRDIAAAEAQDQLHWQVTAHLSGTDSAKTVEAVFHDSANQAVPGLAVTASLEFATDMMHDHKVALAEMAPGVYRGTLAVASGQWDLVIAAKRGSQQMFVSRSRIAIP